MIYREYFNLQYRLINRRLKDNGLNPIVGHLLFAAVFVFFSLLLFKRTTYAEYFHVFAFLFLIFNLAEQRRNDFLKICFTVKHYKIIRILENLAISLPFVIFLLCKKCFLTASILIILGILASVSISKKSFTLVLPTPFFKHPFEVTVGFRNTFYLISFAYILSGIALSVDNFNLGVFSLVLTLLITSSYFVKPENNFYIWQFSLSPIQFLWYKIKIALWHSTMLCLPIILALSIFYFDNILIVLICLLFGFTFISSVILAKYSAYPSEPRILEGMLLLWCLYLPPIMLLVIPYLLRKSANKLNGILK